MTLGSGMLFLHSCGALVKPLLGEDGREIIDMQAIAETGDSFKWNLFKVSIAVVVSGDGTMQDAKRNWTILSPFFASRPFL